MSSLCDLGPVDYLSRWSDIWSGLDVFCNVVFCNVLFSLLLKPTPFRHVTVSSSRRQLYDKVFSRHRSQRDGLLSEEVTLIYDRLSNS